MTCQDCIHLKQNTCEHYHIEVDADADAYRICAEMVRKDDEQKEDCWESISK